MGIGINIVFIFSFLFISSMLSSSVYAVGEPPAKLGDLETVFGNAITWVAIIGGFLAFIAVIIGGFKYIVARGDPKAVAGAQSTLTWAFIGLGLIIVAWLILVLIEGLTGVSVTNFTIPF